MAILLPASPPQYQQPDQEVPESEKTPEWWTANCRYISTFYNRNSAVWNNDNDTENLSPVQRGVDYSLYYIGKQRNINYNHITKDTEGNTLPAVWIKSKKVKNLIDRLAGIFINQLESKEISASSLSERAVTEKMSKWQDVMLQFDSQALKIFDELSAMGIEYNPPFGRKFDTKEEAEQWLTYSFKDDLEVAATSIARQLESYNDSDTIYLECLKQDYAPANWMGIYNFAENGKVKQKRIPFYNLIWDTTSDDPFVRDGRFCGYIERLTVAQVFKRWPELARDRKKKEEIEELSKGGEGATSFFTAYNSPNLNWYLNRSGELFITAATFFWNGPRDTTYEMQEDKFGRKFLNKGDDTKMGEYVVQDLHRATLLGNKYLVEHGYDDNVIRSVNDKEVPELPIKVMTGNTTLGEGVSIIGSIAQLIDDMDAFDYKIRDLMGRNVGKSYVFNGNKLGASIKPKELLQDLKSMNITVVEGTTGEDDDQTNNQPLVYPVDFSLDQAIVQYSNLWHELETRVENLLSLPKIAQGTQEQVVGKGVQQTTIQQSLTGNANLFQNLFKFNQMCLQYCVNLGKLLIANGKADETARFTVGDRGVKALKLVKKYLLEDTLVMVSPKDIVDEDGRAAILASAQVMAQTGSIDMLDLIALKKHDTYSEMEAQLEFYQKKRAKENAEAADLAHQRAMELETARQQGVQAAIQAQEQGAMEKKRVEATTKIGTTQMNNETAEKIAAEKQ